jgi:dUTP pyrophosphatase
MSLYIYVVNETLRKQFREHIAIRRSTDSGLDVLCAEQLIPAGLGNEVKLGIHCAANELQTGKPAPCMLLARSSTALTPLRLANQIGLIDMGYRGEVIARVDNLSDTEYTISEHQRLFQIVQHNWMPWTTIQIVDSLDQLPAAPDSRGADGFGSTGQ